MTHISADSKGVMCELKFMAVPRLSVFHLTKFSNLRGWQSDKIVDIHVQLNRSELLASYPSILANMRNTENFAFCMYFYCNTKA